MAFRGGFVCKRWWFTVAALLVILIVPVQPVFAQAGTPQKPEPINILASASSGKYLTGDILTITGLVNAQPAKLFSLPVKSTLTFFDANGSQIGATTTDANGYFRLPIYLVSGASETPIEERFASILIKALPEAGSFFAPGNLTLHLENPKEGLPAVTILTDKSAYADDETVSVTGVLFSGSQPVVGLVSMAMDGSPIAAVQTDPTGHYSFRFSPYLKLPAEQLAAIHTSPHLITVTTENLPSGRGAISSAYFMLLGREANCIAGDAEVTQAQGEALVIPLSLSGNHPLPAALSALEGGLYAPDFIVKTGSNERLGLSLEVGRSQAAIGVNPNSSLKVIACQDGTRTPIVRLYANNPSQIIVKIRNAGNPGLDLKLVTPSASIQTYGQSFFAGVDPTGSSLFMALDGALHVSDFSGTSLDIPEGNQVIIQPGEPAQASSVAVQSALIDPELEKIIAARGISLPAGVLILAALAALAGVLLLVLVLAAIALRASHTHSYASQAASAAPMALKAARTKESPPAARLVVCQGKANKPFLDIPSNGVTIGRNAFNPLHIDNESVSRNHAWLEYSRGAWVLVDLNSLNGTFVNGVRIKRYVLRNRDQIQMGEAVLLFLTKGKDKR